MNKIKMSISAASILALIIASSFFNPQTSINFARAQNGNLYPNATEQKSGNWYGSSAIIQQTYPTLRNGYWVYHRTITLHNNATCFRFAEIGWRKTTTNNYEGLIAYRGNCSLFGYTALPFAISSGDHTYQQQYLENWGPPDRYGFYVDRAWLGSAVTNFSHSTSVACGGEVYLGVEAMGNTYCGANKYAYRWGPNVYTLFPWGGHTNYVDNAPYTNVNNPSDIDGFWSTGNESPTPIP